jgi:hypothetical protein
LVLGAGNDILVMSLPEFFRGAIQESASKYKLTLSEHTQCYLVHLLANFARTEALLEESEGELKRPTLTFLLARALDAATVRDRERGFQRLGDFALFMVGCSAHSFSRKLIDVDYCIAMGGNAYSALAGSARSPGLKDIRPVFAELALKFVPVMDTLNHISETARAARTEDLLRYYEIWLKTGSRRAYGKLVESGLAPVAGKGTLAGH